MDDLFFSIKPHWFWFVGALLLIGAEALLPGVFLVWLGLAAAGTGLLALAVPGSFVTQLFGFAFFAAAAIAAGRILARRRESAGDTPFLNDRGRALVGRTAVLDSPIRDGFGTAFLDDTIWRVRGADAEAGAHVLVVGTEGTTLRVEPKA